MNEKRKKFDELKKWYSTDINENADINSYYSKYIDHELICLENLAKEIETVKVKHYIELKNFEYSLKTNDALRIANKIMGVPNPEVLNELKVEYDKLINLYHKQSEKLEYFFDRHDNI